MNEQLSKYFDHTILTAFASKSDIKKLCDECIEYGFMSAVVNSAQVKLCKELLGESDVRICATVGFPLGQTRIDVKLYETSKAIEDGASEIDYVINISEVKNGNYNYLKEEMEEIVGMCRSKGVVCKVIIETCYLTNEEKIKMCQIAQEVQPDFVKTSTGFGSGGATIADVALMKAYSGDKVKVKASGGIRNYKDFMDMVNAGAERVGTSKSIDIIKASEK